MSETEEFQRVARAMDDPRAVFVFGSNLAGRHGAGAARTAVERYGARHGQGFGFAGRSFAIPTKDRELRTLPLDVIAGYVRRLLLIAGEQSPIMFVVTRIGCGLAGYRDAEIAPMFAEAPANCALPEGWRGRTV